MIKLNDIRKNYYVGDNVIQALKGVSLEFRQSEFIAILGPSGCGKTTMLNILGGLDKYESGDIMVDGSSTRDFKDKDWDAYRNNFIGFVFQSYNLIPHQTVLQNVELALTIGGISAGERRKRATEALNSVGLGDQLYKKTTQISGGQMQRVAIARALVNNPQVILADEPTGALDSTTSVQIMDILKEVAKDRLVVMVTHNGELAKQYASRIVSFRDGLLVSDTNPYAAEGSATPVVASTPETSDDTKKKTNSNKLKVNHTRMGFTTALRLSLKNLFTKKVRTFITAFAGSIGIISVALVLAITNGFSGEISRMQRGALADFPIQISRNHLDVGQLITGGGGGDDRDLVAFPDTDEAVPVNRNMLAEVAGFNPIDQDFVAHINRLHDMEAINSIDLISGHHMTMLVNPDSGYRLASRSQLGMNVLPTNAEFVDRYYDTIFYRPLSHEIHGLPAGVQSYNTEVGYRFGELTLIVDTYNRIDGNVLRQFGFDANSNISFEHLIANAELRLIPSDLRYAEVTRNSVTGADYDSRTIYILPDDDGVYERPEGTFVPIAGIPVGAGGTTVGGRFNWAANHDEAITLRITRVLRQKPNQTGNILSSGLAYTANLEQMVHEIDSKGIVATAVRADRWITVRVPRPNVYPIEMIEVPFRARYIAMIDFNFSQLIPGRAEFIPAGTPFAFLALGSDMIPDQEVDGEFSLPLDDIVRQIIDQTIGVGEFLPATIVIYARDFETKNMVRAHIAEWNRYNPDREILFNDMAELIVGIMETIVDGIAIIFIAFGSISLIVSSIMIGIITYVSVLERTKEIGILRAIGARKRDISRVFNAETAIIGFAAGVIGMIIATILTFPISFLMLALVADFTGMVAVVAWWHPVVLISISIFLTVIGGLIPSQIASRKDPVKALRTE
ncbi:MAG: ABC transporter ATP-binding protein/permease [Firmicutes bacterium]|nr:ABC transporter ATP-binding protein/permease [Bacillota bacterium]